MDSNQPMQWFDALADACEQLPRYERTPARMADWVIAHLEADTGEPCEYLRDTLQGMAAGMLLMTISPRAVDRVIGIMQPMKLEVVR